jgi:hypothetical protein
MDRTSHSITQRQSRERPVNGESNKNAPSSSNHTATRHLSSNTTAKAIALSTVPKFTEAACRPSELPVTSNGLPPPLCEFPDFCDADAAEGEDVLLEDEVLDLDGDSVEGLEDGAEETIELKVMEMGGDGGEPTGVMD